jgi:hypothetical protein
MEKHKLTNLLEIGKKFRKRGKRLPLKIMKILNSKSRHEAIIAHITVLYSRHFVTAHSAHNDDRDAASHV